MMSRKKAEFQESVIILETGIESIDFDISKPDFKKKRKPSRKPLIEKFPATSDIPNPTTVPSPTNTAQAEDRSYSLTPDYMSFRNTWWGQTQPVNYKMIWRAYLEEPIVRACVDITTDAIIGDGYNLSGSDEKHVETVKESFIKSNFQKYLHDNVTSLNIYGDAYSESIRGKNGLVEFFKPADSATVRIDYDEHGIVIKYIQRVLHRRVDFYPDEMVHLSINNVGGRVYGVSSLQSIIFTLQAKLAAQNFNTEYFRRNGLPRSLYMVKNLSQPAVDRMASEIRKATPQTDILINAQGGEVEHQIVSPNNQDMQFVELMHFLRQEIIAATGVPPIFLGITEGSNRSNAQTQMESWDRKKKKLRLVIEDMINTQILTVANYGFDDVKFRFNDVNSRERLKYGQLAQLVSTIQYITPNQILRILGLPNLEDERVIYDSVSGRIDKKTDEDGDKPLYLLNEERMKSMVQAGGIPSVGGGASQLKGGANPMKNQDKADNANRLNSEQANETRSDKFAKSDPSKNNPYGAVPAEQEIASPSMYFDYKMRLKPIIEAYMRTLYNINYDYDNVPRKEHGEEKEEKKDETDKKNVSSTGKAVFYKDMTQLDELKQKPLNTPSKSLN